MRTYFRRSMTALRIVNEIYKIIRGYTEHALLPVNQSLLTWLRDDVNKPANTGKSSDEIKLSHQLNDLGESAESGLLGAVLGG